jgi:hypothetical protein
LHFKPFPILVVVSFLHGPQFSWVLIFLKSLPFFHAIPAWWDILLPAVVTLFRNPQYPWALSFGFWQCAAASFWTPCHFLSSPTGITAASSLGTS